MQEVEVEEDWTDADEADVPLESVSPDDGLVNQVQVAADADNALQAKPGSSKRQKKGVVHLHSLRWSRQKNSILSILVHFRAA